MIGVDWWHISWQGELVKLKLLQIFLASSGVIKLMQPRVPILKESTIISFNSGSHSTIDLNYFLDLRRHLVCLEVGDHHHQNS